MIVRTAAKLGCLVFAAGLIAATPPAEPNPMSQFDFLTGSFRCTSTAGKPYVESFTRPMMGNWIRATDTAGDGTFAGEHTIGYDEHSKAWSFVSIYSSGVVSIDRGTTAGGAMTTVYPPGASGTVTLTRLSDTSYGVEGRGSIDGKAFQFHDTCTKRA